jgi:hypothetical protein
MKRHPEKVDINGQVWKKGYCDDRSGWWYSLKGKFGELVVESSDQSKFSLYWWPPRVESGEPLLLRSGYATHRAAMKGGMNYVQRLSNDLGSTKIMGLPC